LTFGSTLTTTSGQFFTPADWFGSPGLSGTSSGSASGSSSAHGSGSSWSEGDSYSESEADIPIFFPVPFQELSSLQYYSLEEQLTELTRALKEQFPRHCFIRIGNDTEPLLVPRVEQLYTSAKNQQWYLDRLLAAHQALPAAEADHLIAAQETALLQAVADDSEAQPDIPPTEKKRGQRKPSDPNPFDDILREHQKP
ncbi:MAG: hypothetical protein Q8Q12_03035, partial [bacterium]|nr:hypothetical protein [bacterium]